MCRMVEMEVGPEGMGGAAQALVAQHKIFGATIALVGPLGAGKTALVREIASIFGYKDCSSPTFVLSNVYRLSTPPGNEIEHWDVYRLKSPPEELLLPPPPYAARFIEWANLFPELIKEADVVVELSYAGERRRIRWESNVR